MRDIDPVIQMDGNTEPVIAVIGFPIAGNPSQFALERALQSVGLEWRVFSFQVSPEQLCTALDGLEVLGVRGVLICKTLAAEFAQWRRSDLGSDQPTYDDCLYRDQADGPFVKYAAQHGWLEARIREHASLLQRDIEKTFVAGAIPAKAFWRTSLIEATIEKLPRDSEKIVDADLIVIEQGDNGPVDLEMNTWPNGNASILVIDVSEGHPDLPDIQSLGYKVISRQARQIAMLSGCFRRWTGMNAPEEVILDAIEEYLAV